MSLLSELFSFPNLVLRYRKNYQIQRRFMQMTIEKDMAEAMADNDGSLSEQDLEKIRKYYGLAVPAILGEGFAMLRGKALNEEEREIQTNLGALTGLFDDLYDEKELSDENILSLVQEPEKYDAQSAFEKLFLTFYLRALSLGPRQPIIDLLVKGHYAQVGSREQASGEISRERIAEITREKGGVFLQFYRAGFEGDPSSIESEMLYNIGGVGQLENDIFDVYKDYQQGIKTLSTTMTSVVELRKTYNDWIEAYQNSLAQLDYPAKNKKQFERFTRILYLRGRVCLEQLEALESKHNGSLDLAECSRQELICDMSSVKNQFRLLVNYVVKG